MQRLAKQLVIGLAAVLLVTFSGCMSESTAVNGTTMTTSIATADTTIETTDSITEATSETTVEMVTTTAETTTTQKISTRETTMRETTTQTTVTTTSMTANTQMTTSAAAGQTVVSSGRQSTTRVTTAEKPTTTTAGAVQVTECVHLKVYKATCERAPICAACGAKVGSPRGHRYSEGGICVRCGQRDPHVKLTDIALDAERLDLLAGESVTLKPTFTPSNATDTAVLWSSSDTAVATVSVDGVVDAVAPGDATITVVGENGKTATCAVTVRDVVLELPTMPVELRYSADYQKNAPIYLQITEIEYQYTPMGVLRISFQGRLSYAADGEGNYTIPNFGWRVYDGDGVFVAEDICMSSEQLCIGSALEGMTAEIPHIAHGRYRLELYSTYSG